MYKRLNKPMERIDYLRAVLLSLCLSMAIIIFASFFTLQIKSTYQFHFNDSQATQGIVYNVDDNTISGGIAGYFRPWSRGEFQLVEKNGPFDDPVFRKREQAVMLKARTFVFYLIAADILFIVTSALTYRRQFKKGRKDVLRFSYKLSGINLLVNLSLLTAVLCLKPARGFLYKMLIGISLKKDDTLRILLESPFQKTYLIFVFIICIAIWAIGAYINHSLNKEERLFS